MDDNLTRKAAAARPRRLSVAAAAAAAAAELAANVSPQHCERPEEACPARDAPRLERSNSAPQGFHQRHMPIEPLRFHIPRKTKEKKALLRDVSNESREYEDMMNILTSSYINTGSAGCFTYSKPRLVHSELLEKEFVEKRKEMKSDGRTDKELEESYCFLLLTDAEKLPSLCEKGLFVSQSWITVLGNPSKGVYLSRYSDLLQTMLIAPGATGEIVIFKVMKGKVKSIYENMKNLLDPTPRFDSHVSKNASKVTSLTSYRAFELTQHYFYEYAFDELRPRPRQVCPYAVVSFQFKGKDSTLPSKPLGPIRLSSQSAEGSKEFAQFTVWTGELVKGDRVLSQISFRSISRPFLPHRLPEKLEVRWLMGLDQVTKLLPSDLFSSNLYNGSQEVMKNGYYCSLLEVIDRGRSTTSVPKLLQELESKRVVIVTPLTERGFLFLLSSVQMAAPADRGENWKRCLQALFVFPESRDVAKSTLSCAASSHPASEPSISAGTVMSRLNKFLPALHHALVKARANPPPELSAGVEHQAREYLIGLKDGKVRQYPMDKYDSKLEDLEKQLPPKHHRVNMDGYLQSYLYNPSLYLLSVARAKQMMEVHCGPEEPQDAKLTKNRRGPREATSRETTSNTQRMQQLVDLVLTCKRNAENEVNREEGGGGAVKAPGRKRRLEQETAERTLKFLKASQESGRHSKIPVEGGHVPASPGSLSSVIGSVGLRDVDLREDGSELAARLLSLLTGLNQAARGTANQSVCEMQEEGQRESYPFDRLATKLGLPTNCDIDLRKEEELEEQTAGSVSSLEGFSPSSHSGELNHHGAAGRGGGGGGGGVGLGRRAGGYEEEEEEGEEGEIPWVLFPITGLSSERYTQRDGNIPQDPRFQNLSVATSITTTTKPSRKSPTPSPEPSPAPSPFHCPSPDPSPPPSPSHCPSPDASPPPSPSQCPSPEPSPPPSLSQCPSPEPSPPLSPSKCPPLQPCPPSCPPLSPSRLLSQKPNELSPFNKDHSGANEEQLAPTATREFAGVSKVKEDKPQGKEKRNEEPSIQPSTLPAPERRTNPSPPLTERGKEDAAPVQGDPLKEETVKEQTQVEGVKEDKVKEVTHVLGSDEEEKRETNPSSPSASPLPPRPHRHIDSIVDKHLGDFSSELRLIMQEANVHRSLPQSLHSTANTDTAALRHTSQFSPYVSFYNPYPPVEDYVSSLHDSISSMLTEFNCSWRSPKPATSRTNTDATLAHTVSAFVSNIRASNATTGGGDDEHHGEVTAIDSGASVSHAPALSRGGDGWQPHTLAKQNPPSLSFTSSVTTSASSTVHSSSDATAHHALNTSQQSHWKPQQSHTSEISRAVAHNTGQTQDSNATRTAHGAADVDGGSSLAEPPPVPEPASSPVPTPALGSGPAPLATALNSLISQLQPEVFSSLVEIIKDVRRNSVHFYLHSTEPEDHVSEDVKEHLLKQGNVEQSPLAFLNQENSENRMLVIIKNKDIAGHVHKIPGLVSLKRHPTVVFVGIDTLDDIRNNSYNELFVSGGCIVSDESVLNPDFITHDQLAARLMILEQHSSPESVWRWKVHCKTHKKLKEQARFRRDAATLLEVLSAYQKRQIVEFLPYHHCDMMNRQSPDLDCLLELQSRYTQYRHTVLLTDNQQYENFPAYSSCGIIVAGIEKLLHDFPRLVGYHDIKDKQPIMDDMLAPKEQVHSLSSRDLPQQLLQRSGPSLRPLSHLSDQLVPDASCKEGVQHHSGKDLEDLRLAISQLRAERQAQLQQQLESRPELSIGPNLVSTGSHHNAPFLGHGGPTESVQHPGKKAVTATLDLIHSELQLKMEEEEERQEFGAEGRRSIGSRGGTPVGLGGNPGYSNRDTSTPSSNHNTADSTSDRREKADHQREPAFTKATARPEDGDRSRDTWSGQEQPIRGEGAPPGNSAAGASRATNITGSNAMVTDKDDHRNPALPLRQQLQQSHSHLQQPPHSQQHRQQQHGLLHHSHLIRHPSQPFSHNPLLGPLTSLGDGLLGPTPVWPRGLVPAGATPLAWGFTGSRLLGGYHNPAGQGSIRHRGGQRGGGFNGM